MRLRKIIFVGGSTLCIVTAVFVVHSYRSQLTTNEGKIHANFNELSRTYGSSDKTALSYGNAVLHSSQYVNRTRPVQDLKVLTSISILQTNSSNNTQSSIEGNSSPALYYCNFPSKEDYLASEEGLPPNPKWILKQVQVVMRHGDRSPLEHSFYDKLGIVPDYCNLRPNQQPTHPSLHEFVKKVKLDQSEMKLQGRRLRTDAFPNYYRCGSAMLSQLGVIQHLHNGEILQKAYVKPYHLLSAILNNQSLVAEKVVVTSTTRSRTIQSAVAFLYGLIPNFHLDQINMKYSNIDIFIGKPCIAAQKMERGIKDVRYKSYLNNRKLATFRKLADAFNAGDHAGSLIDKFVTGFLCKGLKLPCNGNSCAVLGDLDSLIEEEGKTMQKISEEASFVNQSMLLLQPLLREMSRLMLLRSSDQSAPDVVIFSGHDTTLKPIIRALDIPEYRWPRLGTRLVFELWFDRERADHFIRILLNGKDYTMKTRPCSHSAKDSLPIDICQAEKFHSFVEHGIFNHFGAKTQSEACAI